MLLSRYLEHFNFVSISTTDASNVTAFPPFVVSFALEIMNVSWEHASLRGHISSRMRVLSLDSFSFTILIL
jgi:hypothetical protein